MPIPLDMLLQQLAGTGGSSNEGQTPLLPVGDVVSMGRPAGPFQGPTSEAADYMTGRRQSPQVAPISPKPDFWSDWAQRIRQRKLEEAGVPHG